MPKRHLHLSQNILKGAKKLFSSPGTWTKGWQAALKDGTSCGPLNDQAIAWDLAGSILKASHQFSKKDIPQKVLDGAITLAYSAVWNSSLPLLQAAEKDRSLVLSVNRLGPLSTVNDRDETSFETIHEILDGALILLNEVQIDKDSKGAHVAYGSYRDWLERRDES